MLQALAQCEISPDLVLGTSIGAVNGALFAAQPDLSGVQRLRQLWLEADVLGLSSGALLRRAGTLVRSGTHLESFSALRDRLSGVLPVARVEDLAVPFQCVAASIERAAEHWFETGPLAEVILASCAVPGILPAVRIGVVDQASDAVEVQGLFTVSLAELRETSEAVLPRFFG